LKKDITNVAIPFSQPTINLNTEPSEKHPELQKNYVSGKLTI